MAVALTEAIGVSVFMEGDRVAVRIENRELQCSSGLAFQLRVRVNDVRGFAAFVRVSYAQRSKPATGCLRDRLLIARPKMNVDLALIDYAVDAVLDINSGEAKFRFERTDCSFRLNE